jgi:hypothetical protein
MRARSLLVAGLAAGVLVACSGDPAPTASTLVFEDVRDGRL